jgi:protein-tyrosine phosphatase
LLDLHCHLLPGVDDGSRSVEQSVSVLEALRRQGYTGLALTPHLLASRAGGGVPARHDAAFTALTAAAPDGIRLYRGAEVMMDRPLDARVAADRLITLNRTRYLLVEFPRLVLAVTVEQALQRVVDLGLVPVLAHPERYVCCRVGTATRWRSLGALLQVDGPTLLVTRNRGHRARQLLAAGLADILAADNHGDARSLHPVRAALIRKDGATQAKLLLEENPARILEDGTVTEVPPLDWKVTMLDRLRSIWPGHRVPTRP